MDSLRGRVREALEQQRFVILMRSIAMRSIATEFVFRAHSRHSEEAWSSSILTDAGVGTSNYVTRSPTDSTGNAGSATPRRPASNVQRGSSIPVRVGRLYTLQDEVDGSRDEAAGSEDDIIFDFFDKWATEWERVSMLRICCNRAKGNVRLANANHHPGPHKTIGFLFEISSSKSTTSILLRNARYDRRPFTHTGALSPSGADHDIRRATYMRSTYEDHILFGGNRSGHRDIERMLPVSTA